MILLESVSTCLFFLWENIVNEYFYIVKLIAHIIVLRCVSTSNKCCYFIAIYIATILHNMTYKMRRSYRNIPIRQSFNQHHFPLDDRPCLNKEKSIQLIKVCIRLEHRYCYNIIPSQMIFIQRMKCSYQYLHPILIVRGQSSLLLLFNIFSGLVQSQQKKSVKRNEPTKL